MSKRDAPLSDKDYVALAEFRFAMRRFLAFSEAKAGEIGLTPQQHQALLAIRAAPTGTAGIGYVAERLVLKPHTATGLVDRLETLGLVLRQPSPADGRRVILQLTPKACDALAALSAAHREEIRRLRPVLTDVLTQIE